MYLYLIYVNDSSDSWQNVSLIFFKSPRPLGHLSDCSSHKDLEASSVAQPDGLEIISQANHPMCSELLAAQPLPQPPTVSCTTRRLHMEDHPMVPCDPRKIYTKIHYLSGFGGTKTSEGTHLSI